MKALWLFDQISVENILTIQGYGAVKGAEIYPNGSKFSVSMS